MYDLERETAEKTYEAFCERYIFLEEMIRLIFQYKVLNLEMYISVDGAVNSIDDFRSIKTNVEEFMRKLFCLVYDFQKNVLTEFPSVKFIIEK